MSTKTIADLVREVYHAGNAGCLEMDNDLVEEYVAKFQALSSPGTPSASPMDGQWRIYKSEELRRLPLGTIFDHSRLGRCWVDGTDREKIMTFQSHEVAMFRGDEEPWDEPMRQVPL